MIQKNDLYDYEGMYIYQNTDYFKFSLDSVLLAEYARFIKNNSLVLELCAGNMASSMILSRYVDCKIIGVEIQKEIAMLADKSIKENSLENNLSILNADINTLKTSFDNCSIDAIICNPPYFKVSGSSNLNDNYGKRIARHEVSTNLENIFDISSYLLKAKGELYMIHRCTRLDEIFNLAAKYNICVKSFTLIKTKEDELPLLVLVRCVKESRAGIKIGNELCIQNVKSYKKIFKEKL